MPQPRLYKHEHLVRESPQYRRRRQQESQSVVPPQPFDPLELGSRLQMATILSEHRFTPALGHLLLNHDVPIGTSTIAWVFCQLKDSFDINLLDRIVRDCDDEDLWQFRWPFLFCRVSQQLEFVGHLLELEVKHARALPWDLMIRDWDFKVVELVRANRRIEQSST